jgi:hypothetical protein
MGDNIERRLRAIEEYISLTFVYLSESKAYFKLLSHNHDLTMERLGLTSESLRLTHSRMDLIESIVRRVAEMQSEIVMLVGRTEERLSKLENNQSSAKLGADSIE